METLEETELCFPHLSNSSCRKAQRPHFAAVLTYIILSLISVLTATLNLLVIISISHFKLIVFLCFGDVFVSAHVVVTSNNYMIVSLFLSRQLHTPTNLLLLSLAVSDFFVGLLMLLQIMLVDGCWYLGDLMCHLSYVFDYIITSASIGNMVLISVDRYVAICEPLHYSTKVTQKRAKAFVSLCWICSTVYHSVRFKKGLKQLNRFNSCAGECVVVIGYAAGVVDLFLSFLCPVTVIIVLYVRVFAVAVSQARAMRSHVVAVTAQQSVKVTVMKSELKAARALGVVVVAFLTCICPYFCVLLSGQDTVLNPSSAAFVICLFYFNSCLNPLIYALFYPWFRKSIRLIVTLKILQADSCEANMA